MYANFIIRIHPAYRSIQKHTNEQATTRKHEKMSLTQAKARALLWEISKEMNIDYIDLVKIGMKFGVTPPNPFASKAAKDLFDENNLTLKQVPGTGTSGKITIADVRLVLGVPQKRENLFGSPQARELALENGLSQDDFTEEEKSGRTRKSGAAAILLADVKEKLGMAATKRVEKKEKMKITSRAKELAEENNIDYSKIEGSGKDGNILLKDIKLAISSMSLEI